VRLTRTALAVALLGTLVSGCTSLSGGVSNPFVPETHFIILIAERAGYVDVHLAGDPEMRFLFPSTGPCAEILKPEAQVSYSTRGRYGQLINPDPDGKPCIPMGVGNLDVWRNRGPRPDPYVTGSPLPRRTARFTEIHRDEADIFLRGRWPLASWIGFTRSDDIVAVVPNIENCRRAGADGKATMEYRYSGKPAYAIMMQPPAKCPIEAFAIPLPGAPGP
jgi:hypothetical protein